ncbi:MAG TPA: glycoside hydrolase family 30 beta sandwich domain-containing protein [Candidatus Aquilonibacter sp.]|nr:glycoside hydrolase family 30 beta sandwich domain-containing protein [Candidatus Aquilonibacter sp.]
MPTHQTRRDFLKLSAAGLASATATAPFSLFALPAASAREIRVWVTSDKLRFSAAAPIRWQPASAGNAANTITLDPGMRYQEILGFGAAFTDSACYMFNQLSAPARDQLFHELFHPTEMNLSVCRTCIGSSDYATKVYSFDEGEPDPDLTRFSIEHDRAYILPTLRQARQANPDLFLFSSPWSPPGWMKAGGSMLGGSMRRKYFEPYAHYFLKFLQGYSAEGVSIQAVTVQNEVDTDQDGRMPACIWPQEYEIAFVGEHLGPLLEQNAVSSKIWILDHNYNLWGRAIAELDDQQLRKYCDAVAWHGYVGTPDMMTRVHEAHPGAQMYWTEGGPDYTSPDYSTDWVKWGHTYIEILRNWCQSITGWNLALDEKGRPDIGPFSCGGMVTINSETKAVTRSGQYWGFAHFSRVIRRGAKRIESQGDLAGITHAAFENPDGEGVMVLANSGDAQAITLQLGDSTAQLSLQANSLTTLAWS